MIEVTLAEEQQINIEVGENSEYQVEIGSELIIVSDYEVYIGYNIVTPMAARQILNTSGKYMDRNVYIEPIPYSEVSNTAGGNTAIIG